MPKEGEIRWRGAEISRLEAFSDCVFAFALTLLVISLEVPKNFAQLMDAMRDFFAFAICFAAFLAVWRAHYVFFRRYGLNDAPTMLLNSVLLFVVLFYVYPLKFVFTALLRQFTGSAAERQMEEAVRPWHIPNAEWPNMMIIYGLAYVAVFAVFALFYLHAYRKRRELQLDPVETLVTRAEVEANVLLAAVGVLSIVIAAVWRDAGLAGISYFLNAPLQTIHWTLVHGRRRRRLVDTPN
ncbi:MAG: DUF1211 domain-containing protein [Planctomycetes bacterium]|nr:DUF1211 domain-containing protein [Planctomycetota bacterium]MBI3843379.1 DUF1211 domain-containing protein [Planctomycetota bacterium]